MTTAVKTDACRDSDTVHGLIGTEFVFRASFDAMDVAAPRFVRMNSPFYPGEKWAVRRGGLCMNRDGEWHYEPMPSSRDAEFYAAFRFDSLERAVQTFISSNK